jgi:hypothetical protein
LSKLAKCTSETLIPQAKLACEVVCFDNFTNAKAQTKVDLAKNFVASGQLSKISPTLNLGANQ